MKKRLESFQPPSLAPYMAFTESRRRKAGEPGSAGAQGLREHVGHYRRKDIDLILSTIPGGLPKGRIRVERRDECGPGSVPVMSGRRAALIDRLEALAAGFKVERSFDERPPPSETAAQLRKISTAVNRVLTTLGLPKGGSPSDIPYEIRRALVDLAEAQGRNFDFAVMGIQLLGRLAEEAMEQATARKGQENVGNRGNQPLKELINGLVKTWVEICGQSTGTSVGAPGATNEGMAGGPLISFVAACLRPLGIYHLTNESIRAYIRRASDSRSNQLPNQI